MPRGLDAVDANEDLARAETPGFDCVCHFLARILLGLRRNRILEVEDHTIDRQCLCLFERTDIRARHIEDAAARTGVHSRASIASKTIARITCMPLPSFGGLPMSVMP